jgi:hypothetical protein
VSFAEMLLTSKPSSAAPIAVLRLSTLWRSFSATRNALRPRERVQAGAHSRDELLAEVAARAVDQPLAAAGLDRTSWVASALTLACLRRFHGAEAWSAARIFGRFPHILGRDRAKKRVVGRWMARSRLGRRERSQPCSCRPSCARAATPAPSSSPNAAR